ncbi:MAG TPA: GGDEF domain-containing protein [Pirellulaceae bacterium]|nr:GGDEF domain-containing protein [Pirellulaceae bacterium]
MPTNADVLVTVLALGALGGAGLLSAGLAIGFWLGRSTRGAADSRPSADREEVAARGLASLQRHAEELQRLVAEHRHAMQGWEATLAEGAKPHVSGSASAAPSADEAAMRRRHLELSRKIAHTEAQLHEQTVALTEVLRQARTDALTEVGNRRSLDEALAVESELWRRSGRPFAILMIDLDRFKKLNDVFGHQAGDRALQHVAGLLRSVVPADSLLARYGGEEFALLVTNAKVADVRTLARKVRVVVESNPLPLPDGRELRMTVSIGAAISMASEIGDQTLARADAALYASKKGGRNCAHWHDGERSRLLDVGMDEPDDSSSDAGGDAARQANASLERLGRRTLELLRMA